MGPDRFCDECAGWRSYRFAVAKLISLSQFSKFFWNFNITFLILLSENRLIIGENRIYHERFKRKKLCDRD